MKKEHTSTSRLSIMVSSTVYGIEELLETTLDSCTSSHSLRPLVVHEAWLQKCQGTRGDVC